MKKVTIITGTSSGLGLHTAIVLAKAGYKVYATMRNLDKQANLLEEATKSEVNLSVLPLDVTKVETINKCIQSVIEKEGQIDLLVNNAGAGFAKTTEHATEEEMNWVTDVNYHGVVRCTKAVLPHMRQQQSGHIINITSVGGLVGQPFNEFYCAAKFAVEGYTEAMATYLTDTFGIKFTLVEPGGIVSEFMASAMAKTISEGQMTLEPYQPILNKYMAGIQSRAKEGKEQVYQTAKEVAEIILGVANDENPPLRIRTSEWAKEFTHLKTAADPDGNLLLNEIKTKFLS